MLLLHYCHRNSSIGGHDKHLVFSQSGMFTKPFFCFVFCCPNSVSTEMSLSHQEEIKGNIFVWGLNGKAKVIFFTDREFGGSCFCVLFHGKIRSRSRLFCILYLFVATNLIYSQAGKHNTTPERVGFRL